MRLVYLPTTLRTGETIALLPCRTVFAAAGEQPCQGGGSVPVSSDALWPSRAIQVHATPSGAAPVAQLA